MGLGINNFIFTESRASVGQTTLVQSNTASAALDAAIVVERSPSFERYRSEAAGLIGELRDLVAADGRAMAVSAGERPATEAEFGEARLRMSQAALQAPPSAAWRFDAAARLAGDVFVQNASVARRAVIFLTSGSLGPAALRTYSIAEISAFMRNNAIAFYPVFFGARGVDEDLAFLASETGGKVFSASLAGGMAEVVREMRTRVNSAYTVRYSSPSDAAFGQALHPAGGRGDSADGQREGRGGILRPALRVAPDKKNGLLAEPVLPAIAAALRGPFYARRNALNFSAALAASGA